MDWQHLLDPQLARLIDVGPPTPWFDAGLPALRAELATAIGTFEDSSGNIDAVVVGTDGDGRDIRALVRTPHGPSTWGGPRPVLLWVHGGGMVVGTAALDHSKFAVLGEMLDCIVVAPDYRVAPESPYPAALDDCRAALRWAHSSIGDLGGDSTRIAVLGESAGGGLAAALALDARGPGGVPIRLQALVYPMLDDRTGRVPAANEFSGLAVWTGEMNRYGWDAYLGPLRHYAEVPSSAAPARASDLRNTAPAFVATGSLDLFLEEDVDYALRLLRAGVPVEVHVHPGATHGYFMSATDVGGELRRLVVAAIRRAFVTADDSRDAPMHLQPIAEGGSR